MQQPLLDLFLDLSDAVSRPPLPDLLLFLQLVLQRLALLLVCNPVQEFAADLDPAVVSMLAHRVPDAERTGDVA